MSDEKVKYPKIGGQYSHFKGGLYTVTDMATHSETQEAMVVYKSLLFGSTYVRPLSEWNKPKPDGGERFIKMTMWPIVLISYIILIALLAYGTYFMGTFIGNHSAEILHKLTASGLDIVRNNINK